MKRLAKSVRGRPAGGDATYTLADYQGEGVPFQVKYLGREPVPESKGGQHASAAIVNAKVKKDKASFVHQHHKAVFRISVLGVSCKEAKTGVGPSSDCFFTPASLLRASSGLVMLPDHPWRPGAACSHCGPIRASPALSPSLLQSTITQNAIHRITSWYSDEKNPDIIAIFTKGEGGSSGKANEYACLVLKTSSVSGPFRRLAGTLTAWHGTLR